MESHSSLDPRYTAVLAMDCQAGIVSIYANPQEEFITRASTVLRVARKAGMLAILIQVGFRPGLPEVSNPQQASRRNQIVPTAPKPLPGAGGRDPSGTWA